MNVCDAATTTSWLVVHGKCSSLGDRLRLELHLLTCPGCRTAHRHLKWLRQGVKNLAPRPLGKGS